MQLIVNLDDLKWNYRNLNTRLDQDVVPVLKGINCDMKVVSELISAGMVAGIDMTNLQLVEDNLDTDVMALRPPSRHEISSTPDVDIFSMSDIDAIRMMNNFCMAYQYKQKIYLMADIGEMREGVPLSDVSEYVDEIREMQNIELEALAANPGCHTGIVDLDKVEELCDIAEETGVGRVSGGSTALLAEDIPDRVDEIRVGEGILTGLHAVEAEPIDGLCNPFTVKASVIKDKGTECIYDLGSETTNIDSLYNGPDIIGTWSDMALVDDKLASYGDYQKWKVGYWGVVRAYDSPNVSIRYDYNNSL